MRALCVFHTRYRGTPPDVAVASITSGDLAWGHGILVALRDHIQSTAEHKSVQWILPKVLEALEALDTALLTTASPVS